MKIVTDCAAELSSQEAQELNVQVAPLYIHFPEGEVSSDSLTPDEFYRRLAAMAPHVPTTAQPSSDTFARLYQALNQAGEDILSIHISSGLSGTIDSARLGASAIPGSPVEIFDTMTLSGGQRFHVLAAAAAARAGWTRDAILQRLEQIRASTEVAFTLDTLSYLRRGGRIGRVQALAGTLLHVKPLIRVDHADGKYSTLGKTRTIAQSLSAITDYLAKEYQQTAVWISIMHGQFQEQADTLSAMIRERLNVSHLEILRISPVLGVHTGPGVVGAAAVPYTLMQDFV